MYESRDHRQNNRPNSNYNSFSKKTDYKSILTPEPLPKDYVDRAEKLMESNVKNITTSKLRNILSLVIDICNNESKRSDHSLTPESVAHLNMARMRIAYECGRDGNVNRFVCSAKLLSYLKGIGEDRQMLIDFTHYIEALVAYHRFYGGREG